MLWRSSRHIRGILQTNGLGWVLTLSAVVRGQLEEWDTLSPQERRNIAEFLLTLSEKGATHGDEGDDSTDR